MIMVSVKSAILPHNRILFSLLSKVSNLIVRVPPADIVPTSFFAGSRDHRKPCTHLVGVRVLGLGFISWGRLWES